jgi:hypothetical protein
LLFVQGRHASLKRDALDCTVASVTGIAAGTS